MFDFFFPIRSCGFFPRCVSLIPSNPFDPAPTIHSFFLRPLLFMMRDGDKLDDLLVGGGLRKNVRWCSISLFAWIIRSTCTVFQISLLLISASYSHLPFY
ncbi:hypothetical protein BDM02DRAFT_3170448 [Thelephora ganbajun]|uniref:Uncharacterized protein n=1 Tax=Thelephora ganbajun TaxID=370292 RepID=A0ACB6ZCG1_THEGA|nr:hypothetical protein BDM02DRAFT_3170448 [Thelephora ganbajun]